VHALATKAQTSDKCGGWSSRPALARSGRA